MKLQEMQNSFFDYAKITFAEGTFKFYKSHLNYIICYFNNNEIYDSEQINLSVINNFILYEKNKKVSNATINKRILVFKLMFKYFKIENEILTFKKLKEEKNTFSALTNEELNRLNNYLNSDLISIQNKLIIMLLIDTGVRLSEIVGIKVKNINFLNNTIYLDITKGKKCRIVPFTDSTAFLLKKYIKTINSERLFKLTTSGIGSLFCRIQKKLGFNKFHPHMLRHTLCSKLHNNGVSILIIQRIMGHSNVSTTQRYAHFDLDNILHAYHSVM